MTLKQIIEMEEANRTESNMCVLHACKKELSEQIAYMKSETAKRLCLYTMLHNLVEFANTDPSFDKVMVLACWELINEE